MHCADRRIMYCELTFCTNSEKRLLFTMVWFCSVVHVACLSPRSFVLDLLTCVMVKPELCVQRDSKLCANASRIAFVLPLIVALKIGRLPSLSFLLSSSMCFHTKSRMGRFLRYAGTRCSRWCSITHHHTLQTGSPREHELRARSAAALA